MSSIIAVRISELRPQICERKGPLTVVALLGPSRQDPLYDLLTEATAAEVTVREVSTSGTVPEVTVENSLDRAIYLMDGQELIGAKQNRILNTDVVVPAKSSAHIPVSCVEAGRWSYTSRNFSPGKSANYSIRASNAVQVHDSLRRDERHDADQRAVWSKVACLMSESKSVSSSGALHDAYQTHRRVLDDFCRDHTVPEEAVGLAVFSGCSFLGLDLFDRHATVAHFWPRILESYVIERLSSEPSDGPVGLNAVREVLTRVAGAAWEGFRSPGLGKDLRLVSGELTGSALEWEGGVVHVQAFPYRDGIRRDRRSASF